MSDTPVYDQAVDKTAEAHGKDEAAEILETDKKLHAYKRQVRNVESERQQGQIRVRAGRRLAELLNKAEQAGTYRGGRGGDRKSSAAKELDSLASFCVSKKEAHLFRQVAKLSEEEFEQYMREGVTSAYTIARREADAEYAKSEWGEAHMPECDQPDRRPYRTIHVHFEDEDGVAEFADRLGVNITPQTRFIHFPEVENESFVDKASVSSSAEASL